MPLFACEGLMNNDVAVRIGRDHTFCEDFARYNRALHTGDADAWPYLIVADGCSDPLSPDTNLGAAILSIAAENQLFIHEPVVALHESIMTTADYYRASMKLHPRSLDATVLTARLVTNSEKRVLVRATAYGDGVFAAKKKDGSVRVFDVLYESGIPHYLNYSLDPNRKESMLKQTGGNPNVVRNYLIQPDGTATSIQGPGFNQTSDNPLIERYFPVEEYDFVALFTDGVHRVGKLNDAGVEVDVPFLALVHRIMSFGKALAGEFVQRRMNVFDRYMKAEGLQFFDDFSVGVIHCG